MSISKPKPVFIGGYMHSGTSLLFELITNSKDIFSGIKETKILEYPSRYIGMTPEKISKSILGPEFSQNQLENAIVTQDNFYNLYFSIYENLAKYESKEYYVDGSPNQYLQFEEIIKLRPKTKLILIKRDPRDIIASLKKRKQTTNIERYKTKEKLEKKKLEKKYYLFLHSFSIKKSYQRFDQLVKSYPQSVFLIDYADLTQNTEVILDEISAFIGLGNRIPLKKNISINNSANLKSNPGKISFRSSYKKNLTSNEIRFIQSYFEKCYKFTNLVDSYNPPNSKIQYLFFLTKETVRALGGIIDFIFSRFLLLKKPSVFFDWLKMRLKRFF